MVPGNLRLVLWIGSSHSDLRKLSEDVRDVIRFGLFQAQQSQTPRSAKPLKGFGGAGVLEIVATDESGTYRGAYTVKFRGVVYVLHVFQKKSTSGIATPKREIELIKSRLADARAHYEEHKYEYENREAQKEE